MTTASKDSIWSLPFLSFISTFSSFRVIERTGDDNLIFSLKELTNFLTYSFEPPLITHQSGLFLIWSNPWLSKKRIKNNADISNIFDAFVDQIAAPIGTM